MAAPLVLELGLRADVLGGETHGHCGLEDRFRSVEKGRQGIGAALPYSELEPLVEVRLLATASAGLAYLSAVRMSQGGNVGVVT